MVGAPTNADVAQWLNSLTGSAKTAANKHGFLAGALNVLSGPSTSRPTPAKGNQLRWDEARRNGVPDPRRVCLAAFLR